MKGIWQIKILRRVTYRHSRRKLRTAPNLKISFTKVLNKKVRAPICVSLNRNKVQHFSQMEAKPWRRNGKINFQRVNERRRSKFVQFEGFKASYFVSETPISYKEKKRATNERELKMVVNNLFWPGLELRTVRYRCVKQWLQFFAFKKLTPLWLLSPSSF